MNHQAVVHKLILNGVHVNKHTADLNTFEETSTQDLRAEGLYYVNYPVPTNLKVLESLNVGPKVYASSLTAYVMMSSNGYLMANAPYNTCYVLQASNMLLFKTILYWLSGLLKS